MSAAFGIHFGGTSVCLACCKDGKTDVVANDAGDRVTPAIVAFTSRDQATGLSAKHELVRNPKNTVCGVKYVLGRAYEDERVQSVRSTGQQALIIVKKGVAMYEVEYKEKTTHFSPTKIVSIILKKMMETAESHGGIADSHDAVITAPVAFSSEQVDALRDAATDAGFNVLRVISEPSAALLAYDIGQQDTSETCNALVYRLGGTSLDVTVLQVNSGMYRIIASETSEKVGGCMLDDFLIEHFAKEFQKLYKMDCRENKRSIAKLRNSTETVKHILSKLMTAQCSVESLFEGMDFQCTVSRGRFEAMFSNMLTDCLELIKDVLNQAGMTKEQIGMVVMCGGCSKMPLLQEKVKSYFPDANVLFRIPPDEVIAQGAAKQAAILTGSEEEELRANEGGTELTCLTADILIETENEGGKNITVLPKFTPIPVRRQRKFTLAAEQTSFCLHVLQAASSSCDKPESLAKIVMKDVPAQAEITAVFHVKSDGSLHVTCTEATTKATQDVTIPAS